MQDTVLSPSEFISALNQTLEFAFPTVAIEGEISNFRVSKNQWVYFNLQDDEASVPFFGTIYQLPGPLQDGLVVRVVGYPKIHPKFGFSVTFQAITPVGEGSIKKAADLLFKKLEIEGLFLPERKRSLPEIPEIVGLITAANSAAAADFSKILDERWGGLDVHLYDVLVQGQNAPAQIISAIEEFNTQNIPVEVIVITRGGGSVEDLAAFSDERVVRAVAASRIPTLVAIGHEVDTSLAELAADQRASTPTNAAQTLVPDKKQQLEYLKKIRSSLQNQIKSLHSSKIEYLKNQLAWVDKHINDLLFSEFDRLKSTKKIIKLFDPNEALKRGYALVEKNGAYIKSVSNVSVGDNLKVKLSDGTIQSKVQGVVD